MISFIIIGRNEEKNLKRCIDSIYNAIRLSDIDQYEIIYVDSKSTDKSIEIAGNFPEVRIFSVKGGCNAAVGRNIGAKESSGNVLYFIDGDMEIHGEFLAGVWNHQTNSIDEDIVSGQWMDIMGSAKIQRASSKVFPGGTFLIKRELWESVNGMRTRFRTGEESDLGLRLMKKGYRFVRKKEMITNHYTVPYEHESRVWKRIWDKSLFFSRGVLLRHHLFSRHMYGLLWRIDKTFILLTLAIIACIVFLPAGLALLGAYLVAVTLRVASNKRYMSFIKMIGYYILLDSLNLVYFFTFYPKDIREEYVQVKQKVLQV